MKTTFNYAALGQKIRRARQDMHLTQEELAEACDLSTAHIGHIERGTRALSIESLITISNVLNISTDYLLLDIAKTKNNHIDSLLTSINSIDEIKFQRLYSVIKILIENADKL